LSVSWRIPVTFQGTSEATSWEWSRNSLWCIKGHRMSHTEKKHLLGLGRGPQLWPLGFRVFWRTQTLLICSLVPVLTNITTGLSRDVMGISPCQVVCCLTKRKVKNILLEMMCNWVPDILFMGFLQNNYSLGLSLWFLGVREGFGKQDNLMRIINVCQSFLVRQQIVA
jgi:hypothetical protein